MKTKTYQNTPQCPLARWAAPFFLFLWVILMSAGVMAHPGNALEFDGDDYVEIANASTLIAGSDTLTISGWVYAQTPNASWPNLDGFFGIRDDGDINLYLCQFNAKVEGRFTGTGGSGNQVTAEDPAIAINSWRHYALVYDNGTITMYRDGISIGTQTNVAAGVVPALTRSFFIGYLTNGGTNTFYFNGRIDEVRLWNIARSQTEIQNDMNQSLKGDEPGLVLYYRFDDSVTPGKNDATATAGYDGVLTGAPVSATSGIPDFNSYAALDAPFAATVYENETIATTVTATDPDGDIHSFSLAGGTAADQALFSINPTTGQLSFNTPPDFESPSDANGDNAYLVEVFTNDGNGGTDSEIFTITVVDVNEPPYLTSNKTPGVNEGVTSVQTVTGVDPEGAATISFSISGGADQEFFNLDGASDALSFLSPPDYEAPTDADGDNVYEVGIETDDGSGNTAIEMVYVTVSNGNDAPTITSSSTATALSGFIQVMSVTATDVDGDVPTFSVTGGADQSAFSVNATTGELTFHSPPDYANPTDADADNVYEVEVTADDGDAHQAILIRVTVSNVGVSGLPSGTRTTDTETIRFGSTINAYRYNLDNTGMSALVSGNAPLVLQDLSLGTHSLVLEVRHSSGQWVTYATSWEIKVYPQAISGTVSGITANGATFSADILYPDGTLCAVLDKGYTWGTSKYPSVLNSENVVNFGPAITPFSGPITNLNHGTQYYVRAYVSYRCADTTYTEYGNPVGFTTPTPTYTVLFSPGPNGTITGNTNQTVNAGGTAETVTATPDLGYHFKGWSGDYQGTENPLSLTGISGDMTVTAMFEKTEYTVIFSARAGGALLGVTYQEIGEGGDCEAVEAVPQRGYAFAGWVGDIETMDNPLVIRNVRDSMILTATFNDLPPEVISVTSPTADGTYGTGETIDIMVRFSEPVYVNGTPQLILETGSVDARVDYAGGDGTDTLTFVYAIASRETTADLDYISNAALSGNIRDAGGNPANLVLPAPGSKDSLGGNRSLAVLPHMKIGPADLAGLPTGTTRFPDVVVFMNPAKISAYRYNFDGGGWSGQSSPEMALVISDITTGDHALSIEVWDANGVRLPEPITTAWSVEPYPEAVVANVTSPTPNGRYGTGDTIAVAVRFSGPVHVQGTPQLILETGSTDAVADYNSGTGADTLTFTCTVVSGHETGDLDYASSAALSGRIVDAAGYPVNLTLPAPGSEGSLGANKALVVAPHVLIDEGDIYGLPGEISKEPDILITFDTAKIMAYRYRFDGGEWSSEIYAETPILLSGIEVGEHTLSIEVKDINGVWLPDRIERAWRTRIFPEVVTTLIKEIDETGATVAGEVIYDEAYACTGQSGQQLEPAGCQCLILARGVTWSEQINPRANFDPATDEGDAIGSFESRLDGLETGTTYSARAYVTYRCEGFTYNAYGKTLSFRTGTAPAITTDALKQSVLILKLLTGVETVEPIPQSADRNGDAKFGIADVIALLRDAAEEY